MASFTAFRGYLHTCTCTCIYFFLICIFVAKLNVGSFHIFSLCVRMCVWVYGVCVCGGGGGGGGRKGGEGSIFYIR